MKYNNFREYYLNQKKLDYFFINFFEGTPPYIQFDFERMDTLEKINDIIGQVKDYKEIVFKIFFWEPDNQMLYFVSGFGEKLEIIKSYSGKTTPGVGFVSQKQLNNSFFRTLLLCHYNKDFSRNPQLEIMPYCLVEREDSYQVFELYDDRGYNLFDIPKTRRIN